MEKFISIIIPNYNAGTTIGKCLEAAVASNYKHFEVIVVDDCSADNSVRIIKEYPCKLIQLKEHSGVSKARNIGAKNSKGEILFFIDADCILQANALSLANKTMQDPNIKITGGTYTRMPYDRDFFSTFQSIFINYFETKKEEPDYVAAHLMAIDSGVFKESGGFLEDSFIGVTASIEDVEFCHRLKEAGYRLYMNPEILVQHIFNFSFLSSLSNAAKRSMFWVMYSINNRDLLADSGCASVELKLNGGFWFLSVLLILLCFFLKNTAFLVPIPVFLALNLFFNRGIIKAFYRTKGLIFTFAAVLYYTTLYPLAIWAGALVGTIKQLSALIIVSAIHKLRVVS